MYPFFIKEETKSQQNSLTQDHTAANRMQESNGMPSHSRCLTGPLAFLQVEMLEVAQVKMISARSHSISGRFHSYPDLPQSIPLLDAKRWSSFSKLSQTLG